MLKYFIKRVVMSIFTVFMVICLTFLLMNSVPGGPFASEKELPPEILAARNQKYGLDKPLLVQLGNYLKNAIHGDFGVSLKIEKDTPITKILKRTFPISAQIGACSLILAILFGIPMGCFAAYFQGKWGDSILRVVTTIGISIPGFVLAAVLQYFICVKLRLLPTSNYVLPVLILAFSPMCSIGRLVRSSMLDVTNQDYIRTAVAKGVGTGFLIFKHTLRNAVLPVVTYLGPITAGILIGGFVIEKVFRLPGIGGYLVQSINDRDYPLIMATTILATVLLVAMNLVVDLVYKLIDPRITLEKGAAQ
jgi:oligopeptide transport system permease protein